MDVKTTLIIPLNQLFKNIINEKCYNLSNQQLKINLFLSEIIYVNNLFFRRNYDINNEVVYETEDKLNCIKLGNIKLLSNTVELNKIYIYNCIKKYKKRKYLPKRTKIINDEINRVINIENRIKNEIINNINKLYRKILLNNNNRTYL